MRTGRSDDRIGVALRTRGRCNAGRCVKYAKVVRQRNIHHLPPRPRRSSPKAAGMRDVPVFVALRDSGDTIRNWHGRLCCGWLAGRRGKAGGWARSADQVDRDDVGCGEPVGTRRVVGEAWNVGWSSFWLPATPSKTAAWTAS